ncbi:MAG: winged helix-turn-helix transcriptional regulator [Oscillibacter sp.]|nr:winged helix-turn-helix transcriptional regulator [Oscillibacter sp.]
MGYGPSKAMRRYNHLVGEIDGVYHEMSLKLGLSDSAMIVLYTICDSGSSCPLRDICLRSGLSKQTVNSALRKLEAEGVVYLEPVSARSKSVCLTEAGQALAAETAGKIIRIENDIFDSWPQADVEQYLELTERFLLALREKAEQL